jgi:hypothetical protein
MTELSLPSPDTIRQLIATVRQENYRHCLEATYLYAGRICEVVGTSTPGDNTKAIGPRGTEATLDTIHGKKCVLFKVHTEKRQGLIRVVALPLRYEPLAKPLYDYFKQRGTELVYPFTRHKIGAVARTLFSGLSYPVEKYTIINTEQQINKKIPRHGKPFNLHALRHLRATELRRFYHFTADDLAAYCGWTLRTVNPQMSGVMQRYQDLSMDYLEYLPKLFKPRGENQ